MPRSKTIVRLRKIAFACVLTALVLPRHADAASVEEHHPANPQGVVEISNVSGSIDVQGWDKDEIAVTGTVGKDVQRVEVSGDGEHTSVRVVVPQGRPWGSEDGSAHLIIHVPAASSISASLVSSDLKIAAVRGGLQLRTVSGDINGEGAGDVHANSVSGNIRLNVPTSKLIEIKTISGDLVLSGQSAAIEATTVSGTARLTLGTVSRARFKSISGDISAVLAAAPDAQIEAESVSGNLKLDFPNKPEADFDIQTLSGDIDNCFGPKPEETRHGPGKRLSFKSGDNAARIHVSSRSGNVRLCAQK